MQHATSNTGSLEAAHYHVIDLAECRERSLEALQKGVLNDLQQGDPQACSAFADYCAERLDGEVTLALCLSRIHGDNILMLQALAELSVHVNNSREAFCVLEVERRIDALQQQAQAQTMAALELDHE